jgi:uncharacterized protein involved in outer membrane biogenesis
MGLAGILRWIAYVVGGLIAVLVLILAVLALVQIPIDLAKHKGVLEAVASRTLDRSLKIDGKIQVTTSLWPVFEIEGVRLGNPKGFQEGDFAQMKTAKLQVAVLPLLLTKIHILQFSVKSVSVELVVNKDGAVNWSSRPGEASTSEGPKQERPRAGWDKEVLASDSLVVKKLSLKDISVSYQDPSMAEPLEFKIDECSGAALAGKPFALSMSGILLKQPFTTTVEAGSLEELLDESRSWMAVKTEIARTQFEVEGEIDLSQALSTLNVKSSARGEQLDSLNDLLKLDLPPLKSYGAGALLSVRKGRIDLSNFEIYVGKSKLAGKMTVEKTGSRPVANIDLGAPMIQLNDFDVGDWSLGRGKPEEKSQPTAEPAERPRESASEAKTASELGSARDEGVAKLFSPEVLGSFDAQMNVQVEKVLSGVDELGSGVLTATLEKGRLSIDPVKLNIPGGSFLFGMSLQPGGEASEGSVRALIENFDFGVIARMADPETKMGGTISLDVDVKSSAKNLEELLANGNGYIDFSGSPENLSAGIIDLWAVNLIAALASRGDENGSKINCVIGRLSMREGVLNPDVFLIDTGKIRICGKGEVSFKQQLIDLKVAPTPKKPEFFNLALPLKVQGKFSDFGVGIQTGGLFGTGISFITSPVHVPLRRLAGEGLPEDGGDVCGMTIGAEHRPIKPPPGCR